MKIKIKKFNSTLVLKSLKSAIIGVILSIILVLLLAFILKFVNMSDNALSYSNLVIKLISIFVAVLIFSRSNKEKLILKGALLGAIYIIVAFVVFSILNHSFNLGISFLLDILFGLCCGVASGVVINLFRKN